MASSAAERACKKYSIIGLTEEWNALIYDFSSSYYMWNSFAKSVVVAQLDNPRVAVPLNALIAELNGYHYSRYSLLQWRTPLGLLARSRSGLALLQAPVRGENAEMALADRFTGGSTTNSLTGHADRTTGSRLKHLN